MPQSETESMAEYGGELDGGRFNEDGSFIGRFFFVSLIENVVL
jgi:hypothetical protein